METLWHYLEDGEPRGPMSVEDLVRSLVAKPALHSVRVWRDGMADWQAAGSVPELRERLPPPPPGTPGAQEAIPFARAELIARLFRRLVVLVGVQWLVGAFFQALLPVEGHAVLPYLIVLAFAAGSLALLVAIAATAYRLARPLEIGWPLVWAIVMFVPCFNLLGLLIISLQAQSWCKRYGIKVGFLGPSQKSIEEVRRLTVTSTFE